MDASPNCGRPLKTLYRTASRARLLRNSRPSPAGLSRRKILCLPTCCGRHRSGKLGALRQPSGQVVGRVLATVDQSDRLPLLAYLEQRAKLGADLPALRAIRDYRRMLEANPSLISQPPID